MKYAVTRFTRLDGCESEEYKTEQLETLAYLDHYENGISGVVVFDPYKATRRIYSPRETEKALAILTKHINKLGYNEKTEG